MCFLFESISSSIIRLWLVSLYLFSRYNLIQISPSHAMLPKHVPRFIIHFLVLFLASTSLILESVLFFFIVLVIVSIAVLLFCQGHHCEGLQLDL